MAGSRKSNLKPLCDKASAPHESPPARRRGLKHTSGLASRSSATSPPARRRGLKPRRSRSARLRCGVASRAEAWVETSCKIAPSCAMLVASRAEAWVETRTDSPSRRSVCVASRAEAWVETEPPRDWGRRYWTSPPARRRGLKHLLPALRCVNVVRRLPRGGVG